MKKLLYSQVLDDLRRQIRAGTLVDRVPPETTLASSFQVSVSTVKKALGILEAEDLIVRIQGRGTFVRSEAMQVLQSSEDANEDEQVREQPEAERKERVKEPLVQDPSLVRAADNTPRRMVHKATVVGVILPSAVQDGFSRRLLSGMLEGLAENGARALVDFSGNDHERESEIITGFLQSGVDGLIIFPMDGEIYNKDLLRLSLERFPIVS